MYNNVDICIGTPSLRDANKRRGNPDVCILSGVSPTATYINLLDCHVATLLAMTEGGGDVANSSDGDVGLSRIYPHP